MRFECFSWSFFWCFFLCNLPVHVVYICHRRIYWSTSAQRRTHAHTLIDYTIFVSSIWRLLLYVALGKLNEVINSSCQKIPETYVLLYSERTNEKWRFPLILVEKMKCVAIWLLFLRFFLRGENASLSEKWNDCQQNCLFFAVFSSRKRFKIEFNEQATANGNQNMQKYNYVNNYKCPR